MSTSAGPLSISFNLSTIKTAIPLIADGVSTPLVLTNITEETVEKGKQLKFEYKLTEPVASNSGEPIVPGQLGSVIFDTIQLYAKEGAKNPHWFLEKLARRIDGLLGTGDPDNTEGKPVRPDLTPDLVSSLIGKVTIGSFGVRKDNNNIDRNELKSTQFPAQVLG